MGSGPGTTVAAAKGVKRLRSLPRGRIKVLAKTHRRLLVRLAAASTLAVVAVLGLLAWYVAGVLEGLPDAGAVRAASTMNHATTLVDARGRHAFTIFTEQRLPVPLSRVSPNLIQAMLAIEDQRFYRHQGIDLIRVAGAAVNNLVSLRAAQGGSTITQQVARLTFLTPNKTIRRKVQEIVLALRLERTFTKDEILELYLNKAYFGDGLHGVEAASLGYFGKHASELSVAEAALIAGLVKSPSAYAPTTSAQRAVARRDVVLRVMRGAGVIDEPTFQTALASPLELSDTLRHEEAYGQYFKEEVRQQLVERFGWDRVYREGLMVETTLDLDIQKAAEAEVAQALADIEKLQARRRARTSADEPLQAALVALDPRTGEIRAMVGGRDFLASPFNRVTQSRRQPGSAFKPFVYAAALEAGYTPATLITGLSEPVMAFEGAWLPSDEHVDGDAMTMRAALRVSSNRAAARMLQDIGVNAAVDQARQIGLGAMPAVPSLALGSGELTLLSLTSGYGAFANEGWRAEPVMIRRVTTGAGEILYEAPVTSSLAVSPATAYLVSSMLRDVVDAGTAAQARDLGFRLPAAGKTGTTSDYRDAWFVGYTPSLATGVWVGYDKPRTIVNGGYAAQIAVPLWSRFMKTATAGDAPEWLAMPANVVAVEIDSVTGRRAADACRAAGHVVVEYFAEGTEPIDICPLHRFDARRALATAPPAVTAASASRSVVVAREEPPPPPPPAPREVVSAPAPPPPPPKKRGFWGRVFGLGR